MSRRAREIETLLVAMFAAAPLYVTGAVGIMPVALFHAVMLGIVVRVAAGKGPELIPASLLRAVAIAFIPFYVIDAAVISRSAIAASTHLVLFIAAYQPIEAMRANNQAQRMLTTTLLFIASLATSTHMTITLFVMVFAFLMFRQLMYVAHLETVRSVARQYDEAPSGRAAVFYLAGATLIGAALFPFLPRVRNPIVQGMSGALPGATTALSETIDFSEPRENSNDGTVAARVWMSPQAIPIFTPLRLRGTIYDKFQDGRWKQAGMGHRSVSHRDSTYTLARPAGVTRSAIVQQRPLKGRLFLPVGTYALSGVPNLYEGPGRESYSVFQVRGEALTLDVKMASDAEPLRITRVPTSGYPVTPQVRALAEQIVGNETRLDRRAARIERYMVTNYRYEADPATLGPMTVDEFLLRDRRGHCEYFAAGMVALLTAYDVPARIVGGFYGGRLNPLTGYFIVRREDAHAWVEVWDGTRWRTYDPTPPTLRPGNAAEGLVSMYASALSDSVNYFWDRYVLTYGLADQIALASDLISRTRDAMAATRSNVSGGIRQLGSRSFLVLLGTVIAVGLLVMLLARRRTSPFDLLAAHLSRLGIVVGPAMTMEDALRALRAEHADAARELEPLIALYEEEAFSAKRDRGRVAVIRRRLGELGR